MKAARSAGGLAVAALLAWYLFYLATPINFATADLGRHLQTGRLLLEDWSRNAPGILETNFYSFTYPDYPVVNHHWGSGVLFHLAERAVGLTGLHALFILLCLTTLVVFLDTARRESSLVVATIAGAFVVPLLAQRVEVRPEAFSYLLIGAFLWILRRFDAGEIGKGALWLLPVLQAIWVNLHIYFVFGPLLVGIFLGEAVLARALGRPGRRNCIRDLALVLGGTCLATLASPHGVHGLTYPFTIFGNYGYDVLENRSIPYLEAHGIHRTNFIILKVLTGLVAAGFLAQAFLDRRRMRIAPFGLFAVFGSMAWLALRNLTLFGFCAIPIVSFLAGRLGDRFGPRAARRALAVSGVVLIALLPATQSATIARQWGWLGLGPLPGIGGAAEFLEREEVRGPILNNYDVGGYLVYHLFPRERVFVDNRPEAYPAGFFQDVYVPLQEDARAWEAAQRRFDFNAIVFMHRDRTPWASSFLDERMQDPGWAVVFLDDYVVVLLRRNDRNAATIARFEVRSGERR